MEVFYARKSLSVFDCLGWNQASYFNSYSKFLLSFNAVVILMWVGERENGILAWLRDLVPITDTVYTYIYNTGSIMNYGIKYEIPFQRPLNSVRRMLNFGEVLWVEY